MRWCTPEVTGVPDDPATPGDDTAINHPAGSGCDEFSDRYAEIHAALATTAGVEDLTNLLHEAETILADRMIVLPLFQNPTSTLVWSDEIAGYVPTSRNIGYEDVWQIDRWYRADAG